MALQPAVERDLHPAQDQAPSRDEPVRVEPVADAHVAQGAPPLRASSTSAQARSSGVVILRLRAEPGTATTASPTRSTAMASSVSVTPSRKAAS